MTAQRRPGRPAGDAGRLLLEVHPDYLDLVEASAERELEGVPLDLVVTSDLPAGTAARLTVSGELLTAMRDQAGA